MKKFYSLLVVASLVALSGCGAKNDEEAAKAVQEGLVNLSGVESGSFEMVISGEMSGDFGVEIGRASCRERV